MCLSRYPNLTTNAGRNHFYSYDIDHPAARKLWGIVLDAVAPAMAGHPGIVGWSLANEPGFSSANSTYTLAKFQAFLEQRYNDSIMAWSEAWGRRFHSFQDPLIMNYMGLWTMSTRQLLDWNAFNDQRAAQWYGFLCDRINTHYPDTAPTACFIKASNSASGLHPVAPHGEQGIGRLQLVPVLDYRGCDTRILPTSSSHFAIPSFPQTLYAMDWLPAASSYALMRSLGGGRQPVMETEWHSISTVTFRMEEIPSQHLRAARWLSHIHGMAANMIWFWGREGWSGLPKMSHEFAGADFFRALPTQPHMLAEYARGAVEVNAVGDYLVALAAQLPQLNLLYSPESLVADPAHMDNLFGTYSLLHSLGVPVGFTTARSAVDSSATTAVPVVISGASYVAPDVQEHLRALHTAGTPIIVTGNRTNLFAFDDAGGRSEPNMRDWAMTLPHMPMSVADEATFQAFDAALGPLLHRPVRCISLAGYTG